MDTKTAKTCGLCLQEIVESGSVNLKKFWEDGSDPSHYFYYHERCFKEVKS